MVSGLNHGFAHLQSPLPLTVVGNPLLQTPGMHPWSIRNLVTSWVWVILVVHTQFGLFVSPSTQEVRLQQGTLRHFLQGFTRWFSVGAYLAVCKGAVANEQGLFVLSPQNKETSKRVHALASFYTNWDLLVGVRWSSPFAFTVMCKPGK